MLKLLDRYLIKQYLSTFAFSLLICTLISAAIDFSDKVQIFLDKPCTVKNILVDYYPGFIFNIASLLMPLYTLIAVVFFTSRLAFNSEILSILNAGVSFNRLLRPYLLAGGAVALLHLGLNHFLTPRFNKSRLWFEHTFVWTDQEKGKVANLHFLLGENTKVYIRGYNKTSKTASGLRLERFYGNRVVSILEADNVSWKAEPNIWQINNYSVRTFLPDGQREQYTQFTTPLDTAINLSPQDFIYYQNQDQELTTPQLQAVIDRDRGRGISNIKNSEIEKHRRTADAATNVILTVIGLSVAGRKVRGGMGLHLALGIGIGAVFILLSKFAVSFASSGTVPVALGMWIPNIIFGAVAIWLVAKAQK